MPFAPPVTSTVFPWNLVMAATIYGDQLMEFRDSHPDQKRIFDELLGLPADVVPIGLALIGKPGEAPPTGSRLEERQRAKDDLVHRERW
jgi:hypothetical protein